MGETNLSKATMLMTKKKKILEVLALNGDKKIDGKRRPRDSILVNPRVGKSI